MFVLTLALVGCEKEDPGKDSPADTDGVTDSGETGDTSDTQETAIDTEDTAPPCTAAVIEMSPAEGTTEVYYRDTLEVLFSEDGSAATFLLTDAEGNELVPTPLWGEGNLRVDLAATLSPNTTYTLTASICDVATSATFTTSMLGTPLVFPPEDLIGAVYMFRISDAEITEPAILEALGDDYLTSPLLFEVADANESTITLLGALGQAKEETFEQVPDTATWPFPAGDFSSSPTFYAEADAIYIDYQGISIPIEHFTLSGTFSFDGMSIEQGYTTGYLDTSHLGPLFGQPDEPDSVCKYADTFGITCIPCDNGDEVCVAVVGEGIIATFQEGVDIVPYP